jgi:MGT family glycosyltransferase
MRVLFTTFEGGGHVPAPLLAASALRNLGHDVLIVSDPCNAPAAEAKALPFRPWRRAPDRGSLGAAAGGLSDWKTRWPPAVIRRICADVATGPAAAYAQDTLELAGEFEPDVIVSNELLFGVMMAAEKLETPLALLTANLWCFPTREDVPPFGPGYSLAKSRSDLARDTVTRKLIRGFFDAGLPDLNAARALVGLSPLHHTLDQLDFARRILIGASPAFDFNVEGSSERFSYCGPLFETPNWADDKIQMPDNGRPNVLISFGTTFQDQKSVLTRTMAAVETLPINVIVTLGPAMADAKLPQIANVRVMAQASHDEIVPQCAAVICHGGHGTVLRPLAHGVPLVVMPMGRDHADNAARLEWLGAGVRISERASAGRIKRALIEVLADARYRENAQRFAKRLSDFDASPRRAAAWIASLARTDQALAA